MMNRLDKSVERMKKTSGRKKTDENTGLEEGKEVMIMIIGGAYQGKLAFAKKIYPDVTWADGAVCTEEELYSCEGIYHFHQYIERKIKEGEPIDDLAEELIRKNPELILITDEIGYGIVPVDRMEREYREQTGRVCTRLAAYSEKVYRVMCGIGQVIKEV